MSFHVYCNPQNVSLGGISVEAVAKISINENVEKFSTCGDLGFVGDGFEAFLSRQCVGSIEFTDPNVWLQSQDAAGTLSFDLIDVASQVVLNIEIEACVFSVGKLDLQHNASSSCVVNFVSKNSPVIVDQ